MTRDLHPDLHADFVLASPPFNDSDWLREDDDVRWRGAAAANLERSIANNEAALNEKI